MKVYLFSIIVLAVCSIILQSDAIPWSSKETRALGADAIAVGRIISYQDDGAHRDYKISIIKWIKNSQPDQIITMRSITPKVFDPINPYFIFEKKDLGLFYLKSDNGKWHSTNYSRQIWANELSQTVYDMKKLVGDNNADSSISLERVCKEGYVNAIKNRTGEIACVKPDTKIKLIERGWSACSEPSDYIRGTPYGFHSSVDGGNTSSSHEITILSISPENVTLPDNPKDKPKIALETKIPINKSRQIKITDNDSTSGYTIHSAQITLKSLTVDPRGNPPAKPGFDTWIFDYSIQNTDKEEYYAMLNFEVQFGQKTYSSELVGDEFYWTLFPGEKRDASYAAQVGKGINQIILNVKDQTTKKTLWSIPLDLTPYKIKYHAGYSNLIQE